VALVAQQAERWTKPEIRLTRRCAGGRLRVGLAGRDVEFVRDVNFKLGRRLAARATSAAFGATLRTHGRRGPLRAVAYLAKGAPARVVLSRSLPRC
jgi:hypothetical protein